MAKQVSPGVLALRKVVDDAHKDAREAKARGELVGWSSSKFPCELAAAFDLNVMYPENQAAGIAANRYGEMMCQAAEDLGYDNDICGYADVYKRQLLHRPRLRPPHRRQRPLRLLHLQQHRLPQQQEAPMLTARCPARF